MLYSYQSYTHSGTRYIVSTTRVTLHTCALRAITCPADPIRHFTMTYNTIIQSHLPYTIQNITQYAYRSDVVTAIVIVMATIIIIITTSRRTHYNRLGILTYLGIVTYIMCGGGGGGGGGGVGR